MDETSIRNRIDELHKQLADERFKSRPSLFGDSYAPLPVLASRQRAWVDANPELASQHAALSAELEAERQRLEQIARAKADEARRLERLEAVGIGAREIALLEKPKPTEALQRAREWLASDWDFLLLCGGPGAGKTIAAANVVADFLDAERAKEPGFVLPSAGRKPSGAKVVRAAEGQRLGLFDEDSRAAVQQMRRVALLVLDDMGTEMLTDVWRQQLDDVIDARYSDKLRTIVTTNLTPEAFKERYGARIADRIRQTAMVVQLGVESMRKRGAA